MKHFLSSFLRNAVNYMASRLRTCAFLYKQTGVRHRLSVLIETLRPSTKSASQALTQTLYNRPAADCEHHLAHLLRQPLRDVKSLLASSREHNSRFKERRNVVYPNALVRQHCDAIRLPQQKEYTTLVRSDERSRIVASFHMGDFIYGSAKLFAQDANSRRKFVLSLTSSSNLQSGNT